MMEIFPTATIGVAATTLFPQLSMADAEMMEPPSAVATGDAKKLFNDGRAFEANGNIAAAQRLYAKVTKIVPRFIYGWSNLGNTQGELSKTGVSFLRAVF